MFAGISPMLLTDKLIAWMVWISVCTLVTELTAPKGRPLIPAPSISAWPSDRGSPEYSY
jgi:hypothetical protein